ncbi:MAG: hypothetical protein ACI9BW_003569 [Gammaproteobacteria bacterium]|jgi:hypothetical protein
MNNVTRDEELLRPRDDPKVTVVDIEQLVKRLTAIYGHTFTSQFGDPIALDTWWRALRMRAKEDLARGLEKCIDSNSAYPPKLPEFKAMCKRYSSPTHRPGPMLERPIVNQDIADRNLNQMYDILGAKRRSLA